jgi:hypothetical protein
VSEAVPHVLIDRVMMRRRGDREGEHKADDTPYRKAFGER